LLPIGYDSAKNPSVYIHLFPNSKKNIYL